MLYGNRSIFLHFQGTHKETIVLSGFINSPVFNTEEVHVLRKKITAFK